MSIVNADNRGRFLANPHVKFLKNKHIVYSSEFMEGAIVATENGKTAAQYWTDNGFDISDFKPDYFRKAILRWRSQYRNGEFVQHKRGRPSECFSSQDEEIAYLKAEISFLKELRALGIVGEIKDSGLSPELYKEIVESHAGRPVDWRALALLAITDGRHDHQEN